MGFLCYSMHQAHTRQLLPLVPWNVIVWLHEGMLMWNPTCLNTSSNKSCQKHVGDVCCFPKMFTGCIHPHYAVEAVNRKGLNHWIATPPPPRLECSGVAI